MPRLYAEQIFPRLMDWVMRGPRFQEERKRALHQLHGSVLEIGFGTALNLPHYPKAVTWLTAVEPYRLLPQKVTQRSVEAPMPIEVVRVTAEQLPFEDGKFDCALSTWTLCTIPDVLAALREIRRVLKPNGTLVFLEHGRSDDAKVARWQDFLNPLQRFFACGCNLNRPIDSLVMEAGFKIARVDRYTMPGLPRIGAEMYRGTACPIKP